MSIGHNEYLDYQTACIHRRSGINLPIAAYYSDEVFVKSPLFPTYQIGNRGTIFNESTNMAVNQSFDKGTGYYNVPLLMADGVRRSIGTHRAIMIAHCPIPDFTSMEVNHIDGIKWNNVYMPGSPFNNLEWVTSHLNKLHAYQTGLNKRKRYTDEQALKICMALSQNLSYKEAIQMAGLPYSPCSKALVYGIKTRRIAHHISGDFVFDDPKSNLLSESEIAQAHRVCSLIASGLTNAEIVQEYQRLYGENVSISIIKKLRYKTSPSLSHITSQYQFPVFRQRFHLEDNEVDKMCRLIIEGYSNMQIKEIMGFDSHTLGTVKALTLGLKTNSIKEYQHITKLYFPDINR